jgi:hypothetical protein
MDGKGVYIIGGLGLLFLVLAMGGSRQSVGTSGGAAVMANNRQAMDANIAMAGIGTGYAAKMAGISAQLTQAGYAYQAGNNALITDATTSMLAQSSATVRAMTAANAAQAYATASRDMAINRGIMDTLKSGMIVLTGHDITLQGYKNALDINTQNVNAAIAINSDNNSTSFKSLANTNRTNQAIAKINADRDVQLGWLRYKTAKTIASAQTDAAIFGTLINNIGASERNTTSVAGGVATQYIKSYYG